MGRRGKGKYGIREGGEGEERGEEKGKGGDKEKEMNKRKKERMYWNEWKERR